MSPLLSMVRTMRKPPGFSLETNTEVTKAAIHWLAARDWLKKAVSPIDSPR